ncbi:hypothetical protein K6119_09770 [Paracrocinitomix mangrovi]|uniref:hypothetical protein n=1 Tax=Paracrocinitomix mangrovi TaxID=2862509 RepID=UPI001C8E77B1|nr:hypothetical protein [Paracrocinitomix mangrovi]UKN03777.1 hypothetical protein K6119_09770 [Paracrocinitomix mangrovi]
MKLLSALFFICSSFLASSQDTLRERDANMYSRYYILYDNGKFEYHFNHCTGQSIGFGTYDRSKRNIKFNYDSIPVPGTSVLNEKAHSDSIKIELFNIMDSSRIEVFKVQNGHNLEMVFDGQFLVSQTSLNDTLIIRYFSDTIEFNFDPAYNSYRIYFLPFHVRLEYLAQVNMKRKGDFYFYKLYHKKVRESRNRTSVGRKVWFKVYFEFD